MKRNLQFGDVNLPCREVVVDAQTYLVPKGVARNNRNKSWQVKVIRNGCVSLSGNFADSVHKGTAGALDHAISQIVESGLVESSPRVLKISDHVTLLWAYSGSNVLAIHASVYSPNDKRSSTSYMVSQSKVDRTSEESLSPKIVQALVREWKEQNGEIVPNAVLDRMTGVVKKVLSSTEWKSFLKVGAEMASARDN